MDIESVKFDCVEFRGHIPCAPNKRDGSTCDSCEHYAPVSKRILIIKLGAIGDVIRTTPLVAKYRSLYPEAHITWVTLFPNVLPNEGIDAVYRLDAVSIFTVTNGDFHIAINLDKDPEACMLLSQVRAKEKYGFIWRHGHLAAATKNAEHKILTGLFDGLSQKNTKSYLQEIFEICHFEFGSEEYLIRIHDRYRAEWRSRIETHAGGRPVIGLNTGCGDRWKTRLWPAERWIELIHTLHGAGYFCLLLGGANEDTQNAAYASATPAHYPGHHSLEKFIALADTCDAVVTQVSLMMHIGVALKKPMVLFNNIFNPHEFELYGRGVIMEPTSGCDCYFGNTCKRSTSCMYDIAAPDVAAQLQGLLAPPPGAARGS